MRHLVEVVIAYRDLGCPYRRASFVYVVGYYQGLGLPVTVACGDSDETFTRASAINTAVQVTTAPVLVQSDPDSVVPGPQLHQAIGAAAAADGLVIPHDRYLYLTRQVSADIGAGHRHVFAVDEDDCESTGAGGSGNVVVFSRNTWQAAGGFDERFGLWGGDDAAFAIAADALVAPRRRLCGDVVHLWHPRLPQSDPTHPDYPEQFAILAQYRDAAQLGRSAVADLVAGR